MPFGRSGAQLGDRGFRTIRVINLLKSLVTS